MNSQGGATPMQAKWTKLDLCGKVGTKLVYAYRLCAYKHRIQYSVVLFISNIDSFSSKTLANQAVFKHPNSHNLN